MAIIYYTKEGCTSAIFSTWLHLVGSQYYKPNVLLVGGFVIVNLRVLKHTTGYLFVTY